MLLGVEQEVFTLFVQNLGSLLTSQINSWFCEVIASFMPLIWIVLDFLNQEQKRFCILKVPTLL